MLAYMHRFAVQPGSCKTVNMNIGIIGGTGPLGRGLATRLATARFDIYVGSRDRERATKAIAEIRLGNELSRYLHEATNQEAAGADIAFVTTPWDGVVSTVKSLSSELAGKPVVSTVNALVKQGRELLPFLGPRGSMAAQVAAAIPHSMVVAAGHHLPAPVLCDPNTPLSSSILVCSDYPKAAEKVGELLEAIPGVKCLYVGSLAQAGSLESLTAALINLNIRYGGEATVNIEGLIKK